MLHLYLSLSTLSFANLKKNKKNTYLNERKAKVGSLFGQKYNFSIAVLYYWSQLNEKQMQIKLAIMKG